MMITPLRALTTISAVTWGAVVAEAVLDRLPAKPFAVLLGAAVTSSIVSGMERHATQMSKAVVEHTEAMTRHSFTMERVFQLGMAGAEQARGDAADPVRTLRQFRPWQPGMPIAKDA